MFRQILKEELKIPASVEHLADLREFVTRIGRKYKFPDKMVNGFKLAIDEAGTNIMRHAYRESDVPGFILIRAIIKKNSLTISLIDQGKYFDPKRVKDPDLQRYVHIGKKGGLGIFIMRKLMDEIDYRKTDEGNELRLTKYRDSTSTPSKTKAKITAPISSAVKAIPPSLKTKYWLRTSLVLIGLIASWYIFTFFMIAKDERQAFFELLRDIDEQIVTVIMDSPDLLRDDIGLDISKTLKLYYDNYKDQNVLHDILAVSQDGKIAGYSINELWENYLLADYHEPQNKNRIDDNIFEYKVQIVNKNKQSEIIDVYDIVSVLTDPKDESITRTIHIRAYKSYLAGRIAEERWAKLRIAAMIALLSCVGSFMLIYILTNPMRKLSEWVRRAEHGELGDEMDIDSSTEIGEIAEAFSEITSKFRESQKNLADQERLQQEMQVAQEIQQTLLPREFPEIEGYELASHYEAAREVGGDYFDFVEVDKDTLGVVVADVSGKGVPGSMVMTMIRTSLRTEARGIKDAAEVLSRVNNFVMGDMKKGMFVTLFYVIIDSKRRRVNYASAGHNPMILYRPSTQKTYYLNPRGFPIGIQLNDEDLFKKSIESDTIQLAENDLLLIYTDGITEAMNSQRELYGDERLLKIIREHGHLRVNPFVEKIKDDILSFTEGSPQSDDITLVSVKEKTSPEKEELRRAKDAHLMISKGKSIREACETVGITTYAYYNKYKKEFEEKGVESIEAGSDISVEAKHVSIEEKTKIFDIIKNHPEFGAKRISEELNTEKYSFTEITENKVYDELVRNRLNTRQLREAFVARGDKKRRKMKSPGTPMLTLDGRIVFDRDQPTAQPLPPPSEDEKEKTDKKIDRQVPSIQEAQKTEPTTSEEKTEEFAEVEQDIDTTTHDDLLQESDNEKTATLDIDHQSTEQLGDEFGQLADFSFDDAFTTSDDTAPQAESEDPITAIDGFDDFYTSSTVVESKNDDDDSILNDENVLSPDDSGELESTESGDEIIELTNGVKPPDSTSQTDDEKEEAFVAVDDLLQQEIEATFGVKDDRFSEDTNEKLQQKDESFESIDSQEEQAEFITDNANSDSTLPFVEVDELLGYSEEDDHLSIQSDNDNGFDQADEIDQAPFGADSEQRASLPEASLKHEEPSLSEEIDREETSQPEYTEKDEIEASEAEEYEREQCLISGLRYYKKRHFNEAIDEFEKAIKKFPNFKEAHSILGNAYFRNKMYDNAAIAYTRVKELDPTDTTAFENMGVIHANRGEYMDAMKEWQQVLEIDSSRDDIRRKIELAARMMMKNSSKQR